MMQGPTTTIRPLLLSILVSIFIVCGGIRKKEKTKKKI